MFYSAGEEMFGEFVMMDGAFDTWGQACPYSVGLLAGMFSCRRKTKEGLMVRP